MTQTKTTETMTVESRIAEAIQDARGRPGNSATVIAADRSEYEKLAQALYADADDFKADQEYGKDLVFEGWCLDEYDTDMIWRVEILLEGGAS